jgi:hypothetical protein
MQKKFTLFVIFLFASAISMAQFQKGTITTNFNLGDIRYQSLENKNFQKNNYLSFNPGIGYFIKKNWEIGIGVNFSSLHLRDSAHGGYYQNSRTVGAFVYTNYYLGKRKLKPYLTFETGLNYTTGKYIYNANPLTRFSIRDFYYSIGGGLNWNISSRFSIFTEATYRNEYPFDRNGYGRLHLTIGARFFLNKRKK